LSQEKEQNMKAVLPRSFVLLAGVVLVVALAAVALLVGARAVAGAESTEHRLMLAALAIGGALYGVARGACHGEEDALEADSLRVTRGGARAARGAFMKTHGY
jgi:hypothetical protein